jgi:Na+-transporting NADH:ubiquinone oxidoreductase subunit C
MKEKISMLVFVLILGAILTSALVAVDSYTATRIERNKTFKVKMRVLDALDIPYTKDDVEEKFSENVTTKEVKGVTFYTSQDGNTAFQISGSGLWGPVHGILALLPDLKSPTIKGISIIHQEETPGLGGRIAEEDFLDKFRGKKISPELIIQPPGKANGENEVDGITGATLSSKAFERIINAQSKEYISLLKENE